MKLNLILGAILLVALTGCGPGFQGDTGAQGPAGPPGAPAPTPAPPVVDETQAKINAVLAEENAYRLGLGQTQLSEGLSCSLSTITGGDRIQASIAGHNTLQGISQVATFLFKGEFNQPNTNINQTMNVLPQPLRALYTNMYLLRCQGQLVVTETNYYGFSLTSDDGSLLYIDGVKVIDNDNNHGAVTVTGQRYLRRGVHTFRLDYSQSGAGNQALVLTVGGQQIDPRHYAH